MISEYNEHIRYLADELGCDIRLAPSRPGMMYVEFGYVEGPIIGEMFRHMGRILPPQAAYMVNLHELGHYAHGHTQGRPHLNYSHERLVSHPNGHQWYFDNGVLRSEAEAWEWALDNRLPELLSSATRDFMANSCIGSYMAGSREGRPVHLGNGDRDYVSSTWDAITPYVQGMRERLLNG